MFRVSFIDPANTPSPSFFYDDDNDETRGPPRCRVQVDYSIVGGLDFTLIIKISLRKNKSQEWGRKAELSLVLTVLV